MPAIYDRDGLEFQYPENWSLADDTNDETPRTISLQAPSGAFWSVDIYPFSIRCEDILRDTLSAMKAEYEDLESHESAEEIAGESAIGHDIYFHCLDFVISARLRSLRHGHATFVLTYQAEDREFDQLEPVFRAITHSLFAGTGNE